MAGRTGKAADVEPVAAEPVDAPAHGGPVAIADLGDREPVGKFDPAPHLRRLSGRGGAAYLDVKWRLVWIRSEHPDTSIMTEALEVTDTRALFKATVVYMDGGRSVSATGHGSETPGDFGDYIEKAETKAIGRALMNLGYGTADMPEDSRLADGPVAQTKAPQSNGNAKQAPQGTGDQTVLAAARKRLVTEMRRVGASPSRMAAITMETTGQKNPNVLDVGQLREILEFLEMCPAESFDPEEVVTKEQMAEAEANYLALSQRNGAPA